jgi:hypothetical protein
MDFVKPVVKQVIIVQAVIVHKDFIINLIHALLIVHKVFFEILS